MPTYSESLTYLHLYHTHRNRMSDPTNSSEVFGNIINGQIRHAERETRGVDPRNLAPLWPVSVASPKDLDDAVAAAKVAFGEWSKSAIEERQKALEALAEVLKAHKKTMAEILSKEIGKSVRLQNSLVGWLCVRLGLSVYSEDHVR